MINYQVYCPSYKRAGLAISHLNFLPERFSYVIHEEELDNYKEKYPNTNLVVIPAGNIKGIVFARNFILDYQKKNNNGSYLIQCDDDIKHFERNFNRKRNKLSIKEINDFIIKGFQMAIDCNSGLWGINCQNDPRFYAINKPFSFSLVVLGTFSCFIDLDLRYDESLPLKEDYDMFLQMLKKHRKVLRFDFLSYSCDHQKMSGGCQDYRTTEKERINFEMLQNKWGSDIISKNFRNKNSINPIIKRPI